MDYLMVKVDKLMEMGHIIKVILQMVVKVDMEFINGLMERNIKGNFKMV
jgi:hypothetical protein